ncbi:HIT family protein [Pelistega suis]|uniref:HIT family protein n=1 Tax=Pelistega suis TaxID=1631957 RepID=A0A849P2A5_9BURK|nr:HIT family protein [Pelistega suis]NOL50771.1 HIT family protein [Pelistega suis]
MSNCILCQEIGGTLIYQNDFIRVINANEPHYPAFTRVILQKHVAEMTDLTTEERHRLMEYVYLVEKVQRECLSPDKINLAQFGTMVPHIHWHIIPRFKWDLHYPSSFWSSPTHDPQENSYKEQIALQNNLLSTYHQALKNALETL